MPSPPAPKKWKAATAFTYRHVHYKPGDPVTDRATIAKHANTFRVVVDRSKPATDAEQPEPEPED